MADPWRTGCLQVDGGQPDKFEDNFVIREGLPDSDQYLKNLESKLQKLMQSRDFNKKNLLASLSEAKQSHLERLVNSESSVTLTDTDFDQPISSTNFYRLIAPEKQAHNISELLELVKYDQLGKLFDELEKKGRDFSNI